MTQWPTSSETPSISLMSNKNCYKMPIAYYSSSSWTLVAILVFSLSSSDFEANTATAKVKQCPLITITKKRLPRQHLSHSYPEVLKWHPLKAIVRYQPPPPWKIGSFHGVLCWSNGNDGFPGSEVCRNLPSRPSHFVVATVPDFPWHPTGYNLESFHQCLTCAVQACERGSHRRQTMLSVQQTGTLSEYITHFRELTQELPRMDDTDAKFHFMNGLAYEAHVQVMMRAPRSLEEAYSHAEYFDMVQQRAQNAQNARIRNVNPSISKGASFSS